MIGFAAAWLVKRGVSNKLARPLVIALGIALLALACAALWRCAINDAVDDRQARARAEAAETARQADQDAADQQRADDARNRDERGELEGLPYATPSPLTDSERAFLRCIRLQQQARADGRPVPAC